jgi:hypothetical protein
MMILDAIEFVLQFFDLGALSVQLLAGAGLVLVNLVDDQGRIIKNHEAFYAKFDDDTKIMKARFKHSGARPWRE